MDNSNALEIRPQENALSVKEVMGQVQLIQQIMKDAMTDGEHYGTIPGCGDKKVLLQPGAEKLLLTFRMAPRYEIDVIDLGSFHREYRVECLLESILTKAFIGSGVGSCSTMEKKYRYTTGPKEFTGRQVPVEYWNIRKSDPAKAQTMLGGHGFSTGKNADGTWEITRQGEKVENENPADFYNTCLKMAKKRALVDAVKTSTAASDIFTQDMEDDAEIEKPKAADKKTEAKPEPKPTEPAPMMVDPPDEAKPEPTPAPTNKSATGLSDKARSDIVDMLGEIFPGEKLAKVRAARLTWCEQIGDEKALAEITKIYQAFLDKKKAA